GGGHARPRRRHDDAGARPGARLERGQGTARATPATRTRCDPAGPSPARDADRRHTARAGLPAGAEIARPARNLGRAGNQIRRAKPADSSSECQPESCERRAGTPIPRLDDTTVLRQLDRSEYRAAVRDQQAHLRLVGTVERVAPNVDPQFPAPAVDTAESIPVARL